MIKTYFSNIKYHIALISKLKHPRATFHVLMWQCFFISEHKDLYCKLKKKKNRNKWQTVKKKKNLYFLTVQSQPVNLTLTIRNWVYISAEYFFHKEQEAI